MRFSYIMYWLVIVFITISGIACNSEESPGDETIGVEQSDNSHSDNDSNDPESDAEKNPSATDSALMESVGYEYINTLRAQAGMIQMSINLLLQEAALNHARYLTINSATGHEQFSGLSEFTGQWVNDRTAYVGYKSQTVSENIRSSQNDIDDWTEENKESVDDLMGAIYHRFGFLTFLQDEIGIGIYVAPTSGNNVDVNFVYNMGNSGLNTLCNSTDFTGFGTYYQGVCVPDIRIKGSEYEGVISLSQQNNPGIVVWPPVYGSDIPPAFYEESPDPLPDYSVSGYPVSIQFNQEMVTDVEVSSFDIYEESANTAIQSTRLLTQTSDPNGKFSQYEYALFPLERLGWNTTYRAEATFTVDGTEQTKVWWFTTRDLNAPIFEINQQEITYQVVQGNDYVLYIPPSPDAISLSPFQWMYSQGMDVMTEMEDKNTVRVRISGEVGQSVQFTFNGGEVVTLEVVSEVTVN